MFLLFLCVEMVEEISYHFEMQLFCQYRSCVNLNWLLILFTFMNTQRAASKNGKTVPYQLKTKFLVVSRLFWALNRSLNASKYRNSSWKVRVIHSSLIQVTSRVSRVLSVCTNSTWKYHFKTIQKGTIFCEIKVRKWKQAIGESVLKQNSPKRFSTILQFFTHGHWWRLIAW